VSSRDRLVAFSGAMLGLLLAALDQTIVATALPRIVADLHGLNHLSWVVTAYLLTSTVTVPLYGKLSDLYGRKRLFLLSIVLFLVGSALCGAAQSMTQLIVFRGIQGLGAGGLIPLTFAVIADLFSPRERGRYQGLTGAVWGVAAVAGPLLGGVFTDQVSWRWIFYVNLPVGGLALIVVARKMQIPFQRREHRIDYLGAARLGAGAVAWLLATVWGGQSYPWGSAMIVVLLLAGLVLIGCFLWVETRAAEPILPLKLFSNSIFTHANWSSLALGAVLFGAIIYIPLYVQGVAGKSATNSGVLLMPLTLSWVGASVISGVLISRTGRYRLYPIVGSFVLTLGVWLLTRLDVGSTSWDTTLAMLVIGLAMGLMVQTFLLATQNAVPPHEIGAASSSVLFFRSFGGAFGTAALGSILSAQLKAALPRQLGSASSRVDPQRLLQAASAARGLPPELVHGVRVALAESLHTVFLVCLPIAACTIIAALLLKELPLRTQTGVQQRAQPAAE